MSKHSIEILNTDVLVLGGGSAASRAALESGKESASTVLVTKGAYGFSGTSSFRVAESAGFSASGYADPTDSYIQHKEDILEAALGPCSRRLAGIVASGAPKQVPFLESLGVKFERYLDNYLATRGCFASCRRSLKIKGHGEPIVVALKKEILRRGDIGIIEHSMATELIVEDGICKGAFVGSVDGEIWEIRAKATIMGTGGAGQLFSLNLNPADVTGDGYALGYRAGAELVNMEFMQAGFGIIQPAKTIFNAWIWTLGPRIYDEDGLEFLEQYIPAGLTVADCVKAKENHYPFSTRDASKYLEIAVKKRCNEGKKVYADLRHVAKDDDWIQGNINLAQMWPITKAWMLKCGIDVESIPVRIVCYAHAMNGGLLIDCNSETTVSHLYAVGEAAGGLHGADRLGGNMFASGQVFGEIAGKDAAQTALGLPKDTSVPRLERQVPVSDDSGSQDVAKLRKRLQQLATNELLIIRSGQGLRRFLDEIERLEADLRCCAACTPREQLYIRETENLLLVGRLIAQSAMSRTESRGSHYREDYPNMGGDELRQALVHKFESGLPVLRYVTL